MQSTSNSPSTHFLLLTKSTPDILHWNPLLRAQLADILEAVCGPENDDDPGCRARPVRSGDDRAFPIYGPENGDEPGEAPLKCQAPLTHPAGDWVSIPRTTFGPEGGDDGSWGAPLRCQASPMRPVCGGDWRTFATFGTKDGGETGWSPAKCRQLRVTFGDDADGDEDEETGGWCQRMFGPVMKWFATWRRGSLPGSGGKRKIKTKQPIFEPEDDDDEGC